MACDQARTIIHGYLDGELDAARAAEFEKHLEQCSDCVNELDTQESLRASIHRAQLYEKSPIALSTKVLSNIRRAEPIPIARSRFPVRWLAAAAAILLLAYASWLTISRLRPTDDQSVIAAQIVDAHLRSLQPGHLVDVISSDQHTVKPWFDGKLDFSPPVADFASDGFPLQGGRLDAVHGRTVAALAYARRKHLISVFIWPSFQPDSALHSGSQQGYRWLTWQKNGMQFCAVSDVATSDLDQLQHLLAQ
jgi:mycothiol system anti-sigma-R factor